jgi:hypothetical protein
VQEGDLFERMKSKDLDMSTTVLLSGPILELIVVDSTFIVGIPFKLIWFFI